MEGYRTCLCRQSILVRRCIFGYLDISSAIDYDRSSAIRLHTSAFDREVYPAFDTDRACAKSGIETIGVIMSEHSRIGSGIIDTPTLSCITLHVHISGNS